MQYIAGWRGFSLSPFERGEGRGRGVLFYPTVLSVDIKARELLGEVLLTFQRFHVFNVLTNGSMLALPTPNQVREVQFQSLIK